MVANSFGATIETDLISLAEGLTVNIEYVISQTIVTAFVPIYIHAKARNKAEGDRLISDSLKFFPVLICALSILIMLFAPILSKIIAPTYDKALSVQLTGYLRLFSPLLVLYMAQAIFHALLNANEIFVPGQLIGLNQSVILIVLTLTIGNAFGVQTLAIGFFAYSVINVCYLGFVSRKYWSVQNSEFHFTEDLRALMKMTGPLLLGYAVVFVNQQVDKIIVSGMPSGTVTAMGYAATLSNFVTAVIWAICSVLYTHVSKKIASSDSYGATKLATKSICLLVSVFLPISMISVLCAKEIVTIIFGRGAFDTNAVTNAAAALAGYGFIFVPYALKSIVSQIQYGHKDTKHPMINNSIGICFNILCSILLYRPLGVFGVTLSSSIAEMVSTVLNFHSANKHEAGIAMHGSYKMLPVWLLGGAVCAGTVLMCYPRLETFGCFSRLLIITVAATLAYSCICAIPTWKYLKTEERY